MESTGINQNAGHRQWHWAGRATTPNPRKPARESKKRPEAKLGRNLIAAEPLDLEQHALLGVVLKQGLARLLEAAEARAVDLLGVVGALHEGLARHVVAARHARGVERGVVDAARGLVDPAAGDALEDDGERRLDGDGEVDRDDGVERRGLRGGAGVAIEDEGGRGVFGGLRAGVGRDGPRPKVVELARLGCRRSLGGERHDGAVAEPAAGAQLAGDEAYHEVVGDEAARLDGVFGHDRRARLDIVPQEVAGADGLELGEALEQALALRALADAGRTDEDHSCGSAELHAMRRANVAPSAVGGVEMSMYKNASQSTGQMQSAGRQCVEARDVVGLAMKGRKC
ncbi:hypothetical protein VFPFJ_10145 [Purpureocillium lilacinum]|uniref:Uncharacterized protein n=1 Tax=Purpureocillium lilacinum TaxID=33203 RepID=A0A179GLB7_PURLI|nr:hypothetical protein VFPFJ_10145 [Purpureocillium lilacinum]OAQ78113.1 hypothetical protein VFPFJ_10145 [Purpureocillium lilacinum]